MIQIRHIRLGRTKLWSYWLQEPWTLFVRSLFQPTAFREETETMPLRERLVTMLRLSLVILLCAYPTALFFRSSLCMLHPALYPYYFSKTFSLQHMDIIYFLDDAAWTAALSCLLGGLFGALFSLRFGVAAAFAISLSTGIVNGIDDYTIISIIFGLVLGFVFGPTFNSIRAIKQDGLTHVTLGSIIGVFVGLVVGIAMGIVSGFWAGVVVVMIGGQALQKEDNILGNVAGLLVGGVLSCLVVFIIGAIVRGNLKGKENTVSISTNIGIAVAGALGIAVGTMEGDAGLLLGSSGFQESIIPGLTQGITVGCAFLALYILSYYRLPLYPISAFSLVRAYYACLRNSREVFSTLHHSALYWDECVFLPLPYLKHILRLATEEDVSATLTELNFIVTERPQQSLAAQFIAYEIALNDLSKRAVLSDICQANQELGHLLSPRIRKLNASAAQVFQYLGDASQEAARYYMLNNSEAGNKEDSYDALQNMINVLEQVYPQTAFNDSKLNQQLETVIYRWKMLATQVQEILHIHDKTPGLISNPYHAGPALKPVHNSPNPVFVGRDDVVRKLGSALHRNPRPTFFLTGERRMGKSSILMQLSVLLGTRYLPVFYDLQLPGICSSTATFLEVIAHEINKQLEAKGLVVAKLERYQLEEAQQRNEAAAYRVFDRWLRKVEELLEQKDRVLLLMFDEFEKLEDARRRGHIDLELLLGWLRSVSQGYLHVALLFCGAKTVNDLGALWTEHFVNVEIVKVSFLPPADARRLVDRPVSARSGKHIFTGAIIEEILRVTHCHPFLTQALCSTLVDHLNDNSCEWATIPDVATAMDDMFDSWSTYFKDLWDRSSQDQQCCLATIADLNGGDIVQIMRQSQLSERATYRALQQLQRRDIVAREQDCYQFAVPIFAEWVGSKHYLLYEEDDTD